MSNCSNPQTLTALTCGVSKSCSKRRSWTISAPHNWFTMEDGACLQSSSRFLKALYFNYAPHREVQFGSGWGGEVMRSPKPEAEGSPPWTVHWSSSSPRSTNRSTTAPGASASERRRMSARLATGWPFTALRKSAAKPFPGVRFTQGRGKEGRPQWDCRPFNRVLPPPRLCFPKGHGQGAARLHWKQDPMPAAQRQSPTHARAHAHMYAHMHTRACPRVHKLNTDQLIVIDQVVCCKNSGRQFHATNGRRGEERSTGCCPCSNLQRALHLQGGRLCTSFNCLTSNQEGFTRLQFWKILIKKDDTWKTTLRLS